MSCIVCGVTVAASYVKTHMSRSHGICVHHTRGVDEVGGGPSTYLVSFPRLLQEVKCPVPGCSVEVHSAGRLREHFMYRHFRSKVVVFQYMAELLTQCALRVMHMPAWRIIRHRRMACCNKNTQMRWRRRDVEIVARYSDATLSLIGEKEVERIEGVEVIK